jgi:TRAP-type mannitol/chloroaromatic compound transport system permease small subunit
MIPAFAALMALQGVAQAIRAAAVLSNRAQPMNRELR